MFEVNLQKDYLYTTTTSYQTITRLVRGVIFYVKYNSESCEYVRAYVCIDFKMFGSKWEQSTLWRL